MDLKKFRDEIDDIDDKILKLFIKRMELASKVASYKQENNLPIFQGKREEEVIENIVGKTPDHIKNGAKLLFANIMDISKCLQQDQLTPYDQPVMAVNKNLSPIIACQGTKGSYSDDACKQLFPTSNAMFYESFDEVFLAVESGDADYGILPIENNTAGEVAKTYELMARYDAFICSSIAIKIDHVLVGKRGAKLSDITSVYSHEQALMQCSEFLENHPTITTFSYINTAVAARMVAESLDKTKGAICSKTSAQLYGLDILAENISNSSENYTKFICISKELQVEEGADTISVALSTSNTSGALYRLLTRFAVNGLNLTKIESRPLPVNVKKTYEFDVVFYLDFIGSIKNPSVVKLLSNLKEELNYYKFLGNYKTIIRR